MTAKPRILHVSTTIDRGGHENHLKDLLTGLHGSGEYELSVAYLKSTPYWQPHYAGLGIGVHDLGMRFFGDPRPAWRLSRLISELKPDIVHAHGSPAEIYCLTSKLRLTRPTLVISRHEERERLFEHSSYKAVDAVLDNSTANFIAISHAVKRADLARRDTMAEKMRVVHYGFDVDNLPPVDGSATDAVRKEFGVQDGEVLFLTLARHAPEKDLPTMLRAFAAYQAKDGVPPAKLAMVGKGPLEAELKALADSLGITPNVFWSGFREDVFTLLAASDVFLLSSKIEGFGLVLLEAMAAARPIIATHTSAIPEIVQHDQTGMLFPVGDHAAMSDQLAELAVSKDRREAMGQAGYARLLSDFPTSKMINATSALYKETLAKG